jgi:hypothetical protein
VIDRLDLFGPPPRSPRWRAEPYSLVLLLPRESRCAAADWLDGALEDDNLHMADSPAFRTGYLSLILPSSTGEQQLRRSIRERVIHALAATGEWPVRIVIVTSQRVDDESMRRWFVEYETGPPGGPIEQPDEGLGQRS